MSEEVLSAGITAITAACAGIDNPVVNGSFEKVTVEDVELDVWTWSLIVPAWPSEENGEAEQHGATRQFVRGGEELLPTAEGLDLIAAEMVDSVLCGFFPNRGRAYVNGEPGA